MKFHFVLLFFFPFCSAFTQSERQPKLSRGSWISELQLNDSTVLPFNLIIKKRGGLVIKNGEEEIYLEKGEFQDDSVHVRFPYFNSKLIFKVLNKKTIKGYWVNFSKGDDYKIPFSARKQRGSRFSFIHRANTSISVDGKWRVIFEPDKPSSYPAVGLFRQKDTKNSVSATFLTETGDYRFLEGNCTNDSLFLSCFDGSHAFLFHARLQGDSLIGKFYSGKHWESEWTGEKDPDYQLTSPDELTYVVAKDELHFKLKTLGGDDFVFPNKDYKNKVTIIQIMGSWCPNCLDEVQYYKELYSKYHDQGLEIISVCYETGNNFDDYVANINRLKNKLDLGFTFLVGGSANKGLASEHFSMLNEVISFPTSIFIGKDAKIKRVHTGFNGPGTGDYYQEYIKKTNALLESLLLH
jgi:thiol-disulfide isomerase/thioredoxin